jgi:pimeloyl-ACP methyl ester carboxylesterase
MTSPQDGQILELDGISLYVEDHGDGVPVLLLHGWPDSARLWRHQVPFLVANGFRVITPDMRGFGRSQRPADVAAYRLPTMVADVTAIMDRLGLGRAHVVGHDWGAAVAWLTAMLSPDRVRTLTAISVPHLQAAPTLRQQEMAWYQLFFQFTDVAEATIQHDDWAWLRTFSRGDGDLAQAIADLSRPGALTASLNWYRANVAPRLPGPARALPPVLAPTLGIWSTGDHYLDGERMANSASLVQGPWRYEEIPGASHWVPLDAPDRLNELLLGWLRLKTKDRGSVPPWQGRHRSTIADSSGRGPLLGDAGHGRAVMHHELVDDLLGRRLVRGQVGQGQHPHRDRIGEDQPGQQHTGEGQGRDQRPQGGQADNAVPELGGAVASQHRARRGDNRDAGRNAERGPARNSGAPGHRRDEQKCRGEQEQVVKNEPGTEPHDTSTSLALLSGSVNHGDGGS